MHIKLNLYYLIKNNEMELYLLILAKGNN